MANIMVNGTHNGKQVSYIGVLADDGYVYFADRYFYRVYSGDNLITMSNYVEQSNGYNQSQRWVPVSGFSLVFANLSISGGGGAIAPTGTLEAAVQWAENIARDDSHGYTQDIPGRDGPDYDCASLIMHALHEGMGVPMLPAYNVGGLWAGLPKYGFKQLGADVANNVSQLIRGDILIKLGYHTEMYCGNGKNVAAHSNEYGGIHGGETGDQTGREICIDSYYVWSGDGGHGWTGVLRYDGVTMEPDEE